MSLKRAFDLAGASAGLLVCLPVIVSTAAAMAIVNRSNPFFLQKRVGHKGAMFTVFKIKTMRDEFTRAGQPLPDDQRTSKLGVLVRKSRLDELPQLCNVLKGDMSLVGPRPLMTRHAIATDPVRVSVKPGITGLAQIYSLSGITDEQQLRLDVRYIREMERKGPIGQVLGDIKIILATPASLIKHRTAAHYDLRHPSLT